MVKQIVKKAKIVKKSKKTKIVKKVKNPNKFNIG